MSGYVLSEATDADIERIVRDSVKRWGVARAERYILDLHEAFENLAAFPGIGNDAGHLREGYFQFPHEPQHLLPENR